MLCSAASPPGAVGRFFPGELQRFVSDQQRFLTLRTGVEHPWQNFPGSIPVLLCCEPDLSLLLHPWEGVDGLEAWEWTLASPAAVLQGAQQSVAAVPLPWPRPLAAVAVPLPLLRAWKDSWLSPFQLEQPKSLTWCKKSWGRLSMGLSLDLPLPCIPKELLERAGLGWPCTWLILFSVLWCWSSKVWKTAAGFGGQAEPPSSTWFWSIRRRKGGLKVNAFVLPLTVGERKSSPGSLECGFGEFRLFREV